MADYEFRQVLVWDVNPGGTVRTLRNGTVTVKNAATDATLFAVVSDQNGAVTFTTTDVPTVYLVSPNGFVSEHITAATAIEAAAAAGVNNDVGTAALVNNATSQTRTALDAVYASGVAKIVYVSPSGNDARNGKTWGTAKATIAAALTAMGTSKGTIVLDNGTHNAGATLAWPSTATCGMVGQGPGNTIIQATAQTGPVLDLTAISYGLNDSEFGDFSLAGDGTSGTAKKGLALSSTVSMVGAHFHDISVTNTGGAPFDLGMAELCSFDRFLANEPVGVVANNVPYLTAAGAFNGNTISRLCLSADVSAAGVGASGAVVIKDNGSTAPHDNKITDAQIQGLRVPTNATIFAIAGNANVLSDIQMFDAGKVAGSTGTSVVRFTPPAVNDLGGNLVRGIIPGKGTDTTSFDMGIDLRQSRNRVEGVKGYRGTNVVIASGIANSYIHLAGSVSVATDAGVVDNSGLSNNVSYDGIFRLDRTGEYARDGRTAGNGAAGPRFYDPATVTNGAMWLGQSSTRLQAVGASLFSVQDTLYLRNIAGTSVPFLYFGPANSWPGLFVGTGSPEGVVTAPAGSLYLNKSGGAATTLYVKESGTSNTGWIAK